MIVPKRGEIWRADLEPTRGDEINKTRPVVVLSDNDVGKLNCASSIPLRIGMTATRLLITGSPQKVEPYYHKAERLCRQAIAKDKEAEVEDDRIILAQIVARTPERHF